MTDLQILECTRDRLLSAYRKDAARVSLIWRNFDTAVKKRAAIVA